MYNDSKDCFNCRHFHSGSICMKGDGIKCYHERTFRSWEPIKQDYKPSTENSGPQPIGVAKVKVLTESCSRCNGSGLDAESDRNCGGCGYWNGMTIIKCPRCTDGGPNNIDKDNNIDPVIFARKTLRNVISLITDLQNENACLRIELEKAKGHLTAIMAALPIGNINTHTPETAAERIKYYLQIITEQETEIEKLEERAAKREETIVGQKAEMRRLIDEICVLKEEKDKRSCNETLRG